MTSAIEAVLSDQPMVLETCAWCGGPHETPQFRNNWFMQECIQYLRCQLEKKNE